jgi:hypothetical protein
MSKHRKRGEVQKCLETSGIFAHHAKAHGNVVMVLVKHTRRINIVEGDEILQIYGRNAMDFSEEELLAKLQEEGFDTERILIYPNREVIAGGDVRFIAQCMSATGLYANRPQRCTTVTVTHSIHETIRKNDSVYSINGVSCSNMTQRDLDCAFLNRATLIVSNKQQCLNANRIYADKLASYQKVCFVELSENPNIMIGDTVEELNGRAAQSMTSDEIMQVLLVPNCAIKTKATGKLPDVIHATTEPINVDAALFQTHYDESTKFVMCAVCALEDSPTSMRRIDCTMKDLLTTIQSTQSRLIQTLRTSSSRYDKIYAEVLHNELPCGWLVEASHVCLTCVNQMQEPSKRARIKKKHQQRGTQITATISCNSSASK